MRQSGGFGVETSAYPSLQTVRRAKKLFRRRGRRPTIEFWDHTTASLACWPATGATWPSACRTALADDGARRVCAVPPRPGLAERQRHLSVLSTCKGACCSIKSLRSAHCGCLGDRMSSSFALPSIWPLPGRLACPALARPRAEDPRRRLSPFRPCSHSRRPPGRPRACRPRRPS